MSFAPHHDAQNADQALSVSQLTAQIKGLVEDSFPSVWVAGEVSNFSRPQSGHCYFTLKDDNAQIRAVVWRGSAQRLKFDLTDGLEIVCRGRLDVYAPRGSYQLVVDSAQPQGVGALELALRKLRDKLETEGLFDRDRKRPLPRFPKRIGFVTSPTGAAVRDFLEVLRRRWAGAEVLVIPTRVQGDGASEEIARAIEAANRVQPALDVLVVGRGGGSIEDLWAFNEEPAVRAIAASNTPTVSAVGHEIDTTLCDFAADVRALTPSEAAERVVPSLEEVTASLTDRGERLHGVLRRRVRMARERLAELARRRPLARPFALVEDARRRLDELDAQGRRAAQRIGRDRRAQLAAQAAQLESLSPLGVLARGYSVTTDEETGRLVRSAGETKQGQRLATRLADGTVYSVVASEE
ncbi:Exodeoxyribonuclease 7 large subunit [Pseudobythopirellula maris]|uniref:Exodeoxyribonuclease 7 large subunit n=1 Tax=Pseudobythopirellula maris TaxID=2527991 RepID=A0A5C5ZKG7_9BACT|nr:exodeoxyribonuclease VII large subunit [Pseudobythopirellula maris]TWT86913.1 Exodeoxyribonuclease 7 large subunit [Pseudobythopirellula maris]